MAPVQLGTAWLAGASGRKGAELGLGRNPSLAAQAIIVLSQPRAAIGTPSGAADGSGFWAGKPWRFSGDEGAGAVPLPGLLLWVVEALGMGVAGQRWVLRQR
jgi:hypothetical protein